MNFKKAEEFARKWIAQKPRPKELSPQTVEDVLSALCFKLLGKNNDHTTFRWYHECLNNTEEFPAGIIKVSIGHSEGSKKVVRIGSVKVIISALEYYMEKEK